MNIHEAESALAEKLKDDPTVTTVGVVFSNSEAYKKNPSAFAYEVVEDHLIVYTKTIRKNPEFHVFEGFKVQWSKMGLPRLC